MPGNYTITPRSLNENIDDIKYLADHQQHVDNLEPPKIDDYSGSVGQMQAVTDPGELGSESQPTSLAGEIERLRFAIKEMKGGAGQWYESVTVAFPTGGAIPYFGAAAPASWVLAAGRTIGNAASGATERAHADTAALFTHLWTNLANAQLPIQDSAGAASTRGADAAADYAANKRLPLPDLRRRLPVGLDAAGAAFDTLGEPGGAETHTHPMPHTHGQTGTFQTTSESQNFLDGLSGSGSLIALTHTHNVSLAGSTSGVSVATTSAETSFSPYIVVNWILKL